MGKDPVNKRSPSLVVQLPQEPSAPSSSPTLARTALAPAPTGGPSPPARSRLSGREEGGGNSGERRGAAGEARSLCSSAAGSRPSERAAALSRRSCPSLGETRT